MIFVALILWALPFFGGLAWLRFSIGPLEARDRAGTARLYPPSNALSRERTIEVGEWVAFRRRYKSVPLATRLVLWTVRGLALLGLTAQVVNVLTPFMKSVVPH